MTLAPVPHRRMPLIPRAVLATAAALAAALPLAGQAARAPDDQSCSVRQVNAAREALKVDERARVLASACVIDPKRERRSTVALAVSTEQPEQVALHIALLDQPNPERTAVVKAAGTDTLQQRPDWRITMGALKLDTTTFNLAPGQRAIGLMVNRPFTPDCGDSSSAEPRLYLREGTQGKTLRSALTGLWAAPAGLQKSPETRCEKPADDAGKAPATEPITLALQPGPYEAKKAHGLRTLRVTATRPGTDAAFGATLRYDGQRYLTEEAQQRLQAWRP